MNEMTQTNTTQIKILWAQNRWANFFEDRRFPAL